MPVSNMQQGKAGGLEQKQCVATAAGCANVGRQGRGKSRKSRFRSRLTGQGGEEVLKQVLGLRWEDSVSDQVRGIWARLGPFAAAVGERSHASKVQRVKFL